MVQNTISDWLGVNNIGADKANVPDSRIRRAAMLHNTQTQASQLIGSTFFFNRVPTRENNQNRTARTCAAGTPGSAHRAIQAFLPFASRRIRAASQSTIQTYVVGLRVSGRWVSQRLPGVGKAVNVSRTSRPVPRGTCLQRPRALSRRREKRAQAYNWLQAIRWGWLG